MANADCTTRAPRINILGRLTARRAADMAVVMPAPAAPRRITIVIPMLAAGGAERLVAILSGAWAERGNAVQILTFDDGRAPPFYPIHRGVVRQPLNLIAHSGGSIWRGLANNWRRLRVLRRSIRATQPDVVISFIDQTNVITVLALLGTGIKTAVWENTDPLAARTNRQVTNWGRRMAPLVYRFASVIVAQTDAAAAFLARRFGDKALGIANPVIPPPVVTPLVLQRPAIIGLGRLSPEKGFDLLLRAFAHIAARFPKWHLYVFGEGPERGRLEALRKDGELADRIHLPGAIAEPTAALRAGDLFVLPSYIEGFSLALCEAMACGLPAVATDCSSGPRSVMRDQYDGLLVPPGDDTALAGAMARLMEDGDLRATFAARAPEVMKRYTLESVLARWDIVFDRLCQTAG
jgi:GalNAc-alpha-(1->4)-GalNAc-alpha-(1->3)-diNAcBac-PP-undecaprenol alpha-1,4-N-acetyl-D-galactosaminyltransferase